MSINFDRAVEIYDETRGFPEGVAPQVAALIQQAGGLTAEHHILEIGVGTGRIALPLSAHVGRISGVDISRGMMARLRHKQQGEPIEAVQASATHLPFPADTFDAALAVHVLHLVPGWQRSIEELERVLRPGHPLLVGRGQGKWSGVVGSAFRAAVKRDLTVGIREDGLHAHLIAQGWHPSEPLVLEYPQMGAPQEIVRSIRERAFSSLWDIADDVVETIAEEVQDRLMEAYGQDLARTVDLGNTFTVRPYLPPNKTP